MSEPRQSARPRVLALGATYFGYYAGVGLEYIYLPFFFASLGLSATQLGVIYGGRIGVGVLAQPLATRLAERLGRPHAVLKLGLAGGFGAACLLLRTDGFALAALAMWLQAALRCVAVPLLDASTIAAQGPARYGRVRLWGSLGFGASAALFGAQAQALDYAATGARVVPVYLAVSAACALAALALPADKPTPEPARVAVSRWALLTPSLGVFLAWNALHWAAVESYSIYFSTRVRELGLPSHIPGQATLVGIVAETLMLLAFARLAQHVRSERLALISLGVSAARWAATAVLTDATALVATQALHAFSFGLWYASALALLGRFAPPERRASLQGLFSAAVLGVGGAAGVLLNGALADLGGTRLMYGTAALLDLSALALALATSRSWAELGSPVARPAAS